MAPTAWVPAVSADPVIHHAGAVVCRIAVRKGAPNRRPFCFTHSPHSLHARPIRLPPPLPRLCRTFTRYGEPYHEPFPGLQAGRHRLADFVADDSPADGLAAGTGLYAPVVPGMSGHIGLREEARAGQLLAGRIAGLFLRLQAKQGDRKECNEAPQKPRLRGEML